MLQLSPDQDSRALTAASTEPSRAGTWERFCHARQRPGSSARLCCHQVIRDANTLTHCWHGLFGSQLSRSVHLRALPTAEQLPRSVPSPQAPRRTRLGGGLLACPAPPGLPGLAAAGRRYRWKTRGICSAHAYQHLYPRPAAVNGGLLLKFMEQMCFSSSQEK